MPSDHVGGTSRTHRFISGALHGSIVVAGYTCVFGWLFSAPLFDGSLLAESDLYEYYLPIFLSPITTWSHFEFGGFPAFADPGDFALYPFHLLFARLIGSWTALSVAAFVLAACFTYAYVLFLTGSRTAAAFAGLAYGLSEAMIERLPHAGTLQVAAWLPLILLAIEHLRNERAHRWLATGALAVGCCFLAGHPQPTIYIYYCAGLYALIAGFTAREGRRYYVRVLGMFILGGLIALVKALPFAEASLYVARSGINLEQFTSHANSPAQMLSVLFPTVLHDGREAPTYVGLLTLALALVAIFRGGRTWQVIFWVAVALFAWLVGVGDSTPIAGLLYYVPLYGNFRVSARHLFLAAFALSTLAGFGVAALEERIVSRRALMMSLVVLLAAVATSAALFLLVPGSFQFESRPALPWSLPFWNEGIWTQFAIAAAVVALMTLGFRSRANKPWIAAALMLLIADTVYSLPYSVSASGLQPITIPASAARPSVHAVRLAESVAPLHQRLLAPGGTHRDAVVPAVWARYWQMPIAGGYGPMLLAHLNQLAQIGPNGAASFPALSPDDVSFDVLAVAKIVMKAEDLIPSPTFEREGTTWSAPRLDINVGPAECSHPHPRTLALALPSDVPISEIAMVGHLRCAEHVNTGTPVMRVQLEGHSGTEYEQVIRAGIDLSERELADPSVAMRAKHQPAHVFNDPELRPFEYLTRIRPPSPVRARRVVLSVPSNVGWVGINRLTVVSDTGSSIPLALPQLYLNDPSRWIETERFQTARTSDRTHDESLPGETEYVVFENRRALPRAWMVGSVVPATSSEIVEAIRHSQLPNGGVFDPRVTALVDRDEASEPREFTPGNATVTIRSIQDGHISMMVDSGGGFLVLSEAFYPGWRARIGDEPLRVERVDLALQGAVVPAGRHLVEFEFASTSLRVGTALSIVGLLITVAIFLRAFPRRAEVRAHAEPQ